MDKWKYMMELSGEVWAATEELAEEEVAQQVIERLQTEKPMIVWEGE